MFCGPSTFASFRHSRLLRQTPLLLKLACSTLWTLLLLVLPVQSEFLQYSHTKPVQDPLLRVLNLNTWGLSWPWSEDRYIRFDAMREHILRSNYDIVLLQEVWYKQDHEVIVRSMPYFTYFHTMNLCSGSFIPMGCSGLVVLSRHPIHRVKFHPFTVRGSFWNFDGEILVRKGLAHVEVMWQGLPVDVFTTHLVSYTNNPNRDNNMYRLLQSVEALHHIKRSTGAIKIFGGDLNALPFKGPRQPYGILTSYLTDTFMDMYPSEECNPGYATFGNRKNTYTKHSVPERIDYLMYWADPERVEVRAEHYGLPVLITYDDSGKPISVSDHEPIVVTFRVRKKRKVTKAVAKKDKYRHFIV